MNDSFRKIMVLILIAFLLCSCGYKDIDKRFFVVTIGIDKAEHKKYKVMLKIAVPSQDVTTGGQQFIVSEYESNSITDAVRVMKSKVAKEIDFSHAKMVVLGEEIVKENIAEIVDWLIRRRDIQMIAWVGVGQPNAEKILKMSRITEVIPSNTLFLTFGETGTNSPYITSEPLFDFRKRLTERGLDPILPMIKSKGNYFEVNQTALFNKEKMRVLLTREETKVLNILLDRATGLDIRVKKEQGEKGNLLYVGAESAKATHTVKLNKHNKPTVQINIRINGVIEEVFEYVSEENLHTYEEEAKKQLKDRVLRLVKKLQKEQLDPVGFGLSYRSHRFSKDDWKEWESIYPDVDFDVNIDLKLEGTGLLK